MLAFDHPNYYIEGNDRIIRKPDAPKATFNEQEELLKVLSTTHSLTESLTCSLNHSLIKTRSYSLNRSRLLIHSLTLSLPHALACIFILIY